MEKVERDKWSVFEWVELKRKKEEGDVEKLFVGWMSEYSNNVKRGVHTHSYSWNKRNDGRVVVREYYGDGWGWEKIPGMLKLASILKWTRFNAW